MDYIMYIFINDDLCMSKGRAAAQVGHIVQILTEELVKNTFECKPTIHCINYLKWKQCPTMIVLQASGAELESLILEPDAKYFIDTRTDGTTELTAAGFFPSNTKKDAFATFNLF